MMYPRKINKNNYQVLINKHDLIISTNSELPFVRINGLPMLPHTNKLALWELENLSVEETEGEQRICYKLADNSLYENPMI